MDPTNADAMGDQDRRARAAASRQSAEHLRLRLVEEASFAARYLRMQSARQRRLAAVSRLLAIIALGAAGLSPLLWEMFSELQDAYSPAWATVAFAIAAIAISFDRFMGWSAGAVRKVQQAYRLKVAIHSFEFDWEMITAGSLDIGETPEDHRLLLHRCRAFSLELATILDEHEAIARSNDLAPAIGSAQAQYHAEVGLEEPNGR